MGLSNQEAHRSPRITPGFENTKEEIDYFLKSHPGNHIRSYKNFPSA